VVNSKYICRVNSTLGSQNQSVCIETDQHDCVTIMTTMTTPGIDDTIMLNKVLNCLYVHVDV
jgi:hypothetical protein